VLKVVASRADGVSVGELFGQGAGDRGLVVRVSQGKVWFLTLTDPAGKWIFSGLDSWTAMHSLSLDEMEGRVRAKLQAGDEFFAFKSLEEFCQTAIERKWKACFQG
jgi:hypothetical protein